jgi:magnesium-transporting ATPase (P-type)
MQAGFTLMEKNTTHMTVKNKHSGRKEVFEILAEFPFDSTRKRMSLIVKTGEEIILMSKGADSIMLPRIDFKGDETKKASVTKDLLDFAKEGLRTLVVAQKTLTRQ